VAEGYVRPTKEGTVLNLRVSPGAKNSSTEGTYGENALKLRVAAPPADGKANEELRRFLAGLFGIPRSDVELVRGASSRDKSVLIRDTSEEEVIGALLPYAGR
jgi:uncharacterized protein (TIGR00251 family)